MITKQPAGSLPAAIYLLALSLFAMGTAEFLMGGILPMIANDLQISLPKAGTLISAFAVGAFIGAPPFAILALQWPKRATLVASQLAFITATVVSLVTPDYGSILLARFAMGLAYACFWAVAASTAVQLSPPGRHARAISIVVSGLTIAMVLGGPLGTFISEATGWRGGFWAVVVLTVMAASAGLWVLPKKTSGNVQESSLKTELRAMKRPALWLVFATTAVTTAAYMGTFGYLGALLLDVSELPASWLPGVLTLFGIGAFIGLTIGGRAADRHPFTTLTVGVVGLIFVSTTIALLASNLAAIIALVFLLGVTGFLLNPAVWSRVYFVAPDAPMLAGAMNTSAFQAGLTLAPLLTGLPISLGYGLPIVGWVGSALGIVALGLVLLERRFSNAGDSASRAWHFAAAGLKNEPVCDRSLKGG